MIDKEAVEKLRARGKRRGYLTFDEVEALPADIVSSEEIERVLRNWQSWASNWSKGPPR